MELVLWTNEVMDCWLGDSEEEFADDDVPSLGSLRKYSVNDLRRFHEFERRKSLLSLVHFFVGPSRRADERYYQLVSSPHPGLSWHSCVVERWFAFREPVYPGRIVFWNESGCEWFYIDAPGRGWRRYVWYRRYPRMENKFYWWFHALELRCFLEPELPCV